MMNMIDGILRELRWSPRYGWHDDHRKLDRTDGYLPAMQQVRSEFSEFVEEVIARHGLLGGKCLQLGLGECDASHHVWRSLFSTVLTIDFRATLHDDDTFPGQDTRSPEARVQAGKVGKFDLLFIDAGHTYDAVQADFENYCGMVRKDGVIAFHDACKRRGYEDEIHVWRFMDRLKYIHGHDVRLIGSEVGIAWMLA